MAAAMITARQSAPTLMPMQSYGTRRLRGTTTKANASGSFPQSTSEKTTAPRRETSHGEHHDFETCARSYHLFKRCAEHGETEGFSCSSALRSFANCSLGECIRPDS